MHQKAVLLSSVNFGNPAEFPQKPPELQHHSSTLRALSPWQKTLKAQTVEFGLQTTDLDPGQSRQKTKNTVPIEGAQSFFFMK